MFQEVRANARVPIRKNIAAKENIPFLTFPMPTSNKSISWFDPAPSILFVAEKALVFWRMVFGEGGFAVWIVAFLAVAFRFLFRLVEENGMDLVTGQFDGGLRRSAPEEKKNPAAEQHEDNVEEHGLATLGR